MTMTLVISKYSVTLDTRGHGRLIYHIAASSPAKARAIVLAHEGCPPSCVRRTRRLRVLT